MVITAIAINFAAVKKFCTFVAMLTLKQLIAETSTEKKSRHEFVSNKAKSFSIVHRYPTGISFISKIYCTCPLHIEITLKHCINSYQSVILKNKKFPTQNNAERVGEREEEEEERSNVHYKNSAGA